MTREAIERLVGDLRAVIRDGQDVLRSSADDLSEKGREARGRLEETLNRAKQSCEQLEVRAGEATRAAEATIRDHPLATVGIAVGVGVLVGLVLQRR